MKIVEYSDKYLEDVKDLLVELEEYIVSIDKDGSIKFSKLLLPTPLCPVNTLTLSFKYSFKSFKTSSLHEVIMVLYPILS